MNDLIDTVFGDPYITLNCDSGECLHSTMIPGYEVSQDGPRTRAKADIPLRSLHGPTTVSGSQLALPPRELLFSCVVCVSPWLACLIQRCPFVLSF